MSEQEAMAAAARLLGESEEAITVSFGEGADGEGWYAWLTEYPDEGSMRVDT